MILCARICFYRILSRLCHGTSFKLMLYTNCVDKVYVFGKITGLWDISLASVYGRVVKGRPSVSRFIQDNKTTNRTGLSMSEFGFDDPLENISSISSRLIEVVKVEAEAGVGLGRNIRREENCWPSVTKLWLSKRLGPTPLVHDSRPSFFFVFFMWKYKIGKKI